MKKIFYLGAAMFLMASCGSSETKTTDAAEDTFGMEMPVEAIEMEVPYEGTGNMSDNGDAVSEGVVDKELSGKAEDAVEDAKAKASDAISKSKEKLKQMTEED